MCNISDQSVIPWVDTLLYDIWFMWHNDYSRHTLVLLFWGQLKLYKLRRLATWDIWYIDEGFLIWIIPLTCQSRESIIWACTTSFVHTCIYHMFNVFNACLIYLSHVYVYLCSSYCFLCMFPISDLLIYMIYCRSFNFLYVTCRYLYMHAWTTSLDHVHVCLVCTPLGFIICTHGLHLTTLYSHVQILESGPWWLCCS